MSGVTGGPVLRLVPPDRADHRRPTASPRLLTDPVRFPAYGVGEAARAQSLEEHRAAYGPQRATVGSADELLALLDDVSLTGRGGGHFPAAAKWRAVRDAARRSGAAPLVVGNGAEGEPASAKDLALLTTRPHLVLDGLADAAVTVGASDTVLWLHGDAHAAHRSVSAALAERRAAGLVEARVRLVSAPSHYLSGESGAVVRALSGGPALPETRRMPAAVAGVDGRPTLVSNVETLARASLLARTGLAGYRPTALVTVVTRGRRTVVEVDAGARLRAAVLLGGWPAAEEPQAVLLGGYGGSWQPWTRVAGLELRESSLRTAGTSLGAGVLAPLPRGACGVAETARLAAYLAASSARQCGPCLFGLDAIARALGELQEGSAGWRDVDRLRRWADEVHARGACHHPDGAVRMVLSALTTFDDDVLAHRRRRPCPAAAAVPLLPVPRVPS